MKKLITIVTIAVVSLNFVSCRQDDETTDFNNNTTQEKVAGEKVAIPVKTDSVKVAHKEVDPYPPVRDGTSW